MLWTRPDPPGRLRLGYCTNLHPATTFAELLEGLRTVSVPLRRRVAPEDRFGVGLWLAAPLAAELAAPSGSERLAELAAFLEREGLTPYTFNAFPYGDFHRAGLKRDVFRPSWAEEERLAYTLDVARVARRLCPARVSHVAISTHTGGFGADFSEPEARRAAARNLARCALALARHEEEGGPRLVLALEAEPRSLANDVAALAAWFDELLPIGLETLAPRLDLAREDAERLLRRHLGWCVDACHAAVEFEAAEDVVAAVRASGFAFGKLQHSSALRLERPGDQPRAVEALLAMDEPRYLHQVTALDAAGTSRLGVLDLPELAALLERGGDEAAAWRAAREWRCHFHVPVDRAQLDAAGLSATRDDAERLLARFGADPAPPGAAELHVEIETYTWDVLSVAARGPGDLVELLEREVDRVALVLRRAGWRPALDPAPATRNPPSPR